MAHLVLKAKCGKQAISILQCIQLTLTCPRNILEIHRNRIAKHLCKSLNAN